MENLNIIDLKIGNGAKGKLNKITDVKGVKVGHKSIKNQNHNTGVTVIIPSDKNPFIHKLVAASFVLNGFGKTQGLVQVEELGTLETPIALTNTLNVGKVHDAIVDYMIECCNLDGVNVTSINPIVGECNDASLNDIQKRVVTEKDVREAIFNAGENFEEGSVGAGSGTTCYGCKGGIGSSSRVLNYDNKEYTIGVLVQSNFGKTTDLQINGVNIGEPLAKKIEESKLDQGSIMMVLATDLPVSDRQLKRILKRCSVGLIRTGSFMGHGSGDIMVGFSTANEINITDSSEIRTYSCIREERIDEAFRMAAEATEEAIIRSMLQAETTCFKHTQTRYSFCSFMDGMAELLL